MLAWTGSRQAGCFKTTNRNIASEPNTSGNHLEPDDEFSDFPARCVADPNLITPAELKAVKDDPSVFLVDIRTSREWMHGRIPGAVLIPLSDLPSRLDEIPRQRHVIIYCRSGNRTLRGLHILRKAGYPSARHLRGGILVWDGPIETDS